MTTINLRTAPTLGLAMLPLLIILATPCANAFYNTSTGRWLSRDPIEERSGVNIYSTENALVNQVDPLGLCPCCECAVAIDIQDGGFFPPDGWDFGVYIYLEYHPGKKEGFARYKYEEKTHEPVPEIIRAGGKPDEWYDYFEKVPNAIPPTWKNRPKTCIPPVGRLARDYDWVRRPVRKGPWTIQFRLTVINPPDCGCEVPQVQTSAILILDPASPTHGSFKTPDPNQ